MVIILLLAALAMLVWKEWNRKPSRHLAYRIIATALALVALLDLAIPFHVFPSKTGAGGKQAILLSPGYVEDSVKRFIAANGLRSTLLLPAYYNSAADSGFEALHLFGFGLNPEEIQGLRGLPLVFHPGSLPTGIESISWERKITEGNSLQIQGRFHNTANHPVRLFLTATGTRLDSLTLPAAGNAPFQLSTIPRQLGRYRYQLLAVSGRDTLEKEWIPVEVIPGKTIRVLILASSPGFENKFLSQWLSRKGYPVVTRTLISKNKFGKSILNEPAGTMDQLSASSFQSFDLVISDPASLDALEAPAKTAILKQIEEAGLGLVVRADSSLNPRAWYAQPFRLLPPTTSLAANLWIRFIETNDKGYPVLMDPVIYISREKATQVWVKDSTGNALVGSCIQGAGRKVLITLQSTYPWLLSGDSVIYEKFWTPILQRAARPELVDENWSIENPFPGVDRPVDISFETTSENIPFLHINEIHLPMAQDPLLSFRWRGRFWPGREGWQAAIPGKGERFWWWANGKTDWQTLHYAQRLKAIQAFISNTQLTTAPQPPIAGKSPMPRIIPFLLFITCCAYLWIENKLYGHRI